LKEEKKLKEEIVKEITSEIQVIIKENQDLPINTMCNLKEYEFKIELKDFELSYICQYLISEKMKVKVSERTEE
jgi:hypothetical protein